MGEIMATQQEIEKLSYDWYMLIWDINNREYWNEKLFVSSIVKSAAAIRPYVTDHNEVTLPRIVITLTQMLVEYAKATPVLPWVKYQAASLYLADHVARWLNQSESLIEQNIKDLSENNIYAILDEYEKHIRYDGVRTMFY